MLDAINQRIRKMKVLFVIRKSRVNAKGECPINCRVTIEGISATPFSTGVFVSPKFWDSKVQRCKNSPAANIELDRIRNDLMTIYFQEMARSNHVSTYRVVEIFKGDKPSNVDWKEVIESRIERLRAKKRSVRTLSAYQRHYNNFAKFVKVPPAFVERRNIAQYYNHILIKGYVRDYCNKTIQVLFGLFRDLVNTGIRTNNPVEGFEMEWENKEDNTCLDEAEILALISLEWSEALQKTVDAFLFMCYSGMHVGDYLKFSSSHIKSNREGEYIEYIRQKTKTITQVPFNPVLASIILKYGSAEKLPKQAAQRMNGYLKIVGERIGTQKKLTNKVARKTFTDFCLNERKMTKDATAAMLGHTNTEQIDAYGKVRINRILSEWKNDPLTDKIVKALMSSPK